MGKCISIWLIFQLLLMEIVAQQPKLVLPIGHSGIIMAATFSPDGKKIITASDDNTAKIWDAKTGMLLSELKHSSGVNSIQFSPDGKKIITASDDNTAKIWDAKTGLLLFNLTRHFAVVKHAIFSPDEKKVITAAGDPRIWDANSGELIQEFKSIYAGFVSYAEYDAAMKKILFRGDGIVITDASTGTTISNLRGNDELKPKERHIHDAHFSPDGAFVVAAFEDNTSRVYNATSGKILFELKEYAPVYSAKYSGDGSLIVTAADSVKIWDAKSGKLLRVLGQTTSGYAEFSNDHSMVVVATQTGCSVFNTSTGKLIRNYSGHKKIVYTAKFSQDNRKILTSSEDFTAKIWDVQRGNMLTDFTGKMESITLAAFFPDHNKILVSGTDPSLKILDITTGEFIRKFSGIENPQDIATFTNDGKKIATTSRIDKIIKVWDTETGALLFNIKGHTWIINSLRFSSDGSKLVAASDDHTATAWDVDDGKFLFRMEHKFKVQDAEFSPDNTKIVTASDDGTAKVWNTATGEILATLIHYKDSSVATADDDVISAKFSPDGSKILTACWDKTAKIWDANSGMIIKTLSGHSDWLNFADYSPDGKTVVTCSRDNKVIIWNSLTGSFLKEIKCSYDPSVIKLLDDNKRLITIWFTYGVGHKAELWDIDTNSLLAELSGAADGVKSISVSKDGKRLLEVLNNNSINIKEIDTDKLLYTFIGINKDNYLLKIPSGEYFSTKEAARLLHYVTRDLNVITFEQLDIRYNRPDRVLETLGNNDSNVVKAYRQAYNKRIKKLNIDTTAFSEGYSVPYLDFANRDSIEFEQNSGSLSLHIKGGDSTFLLNRFNVWINEVPVFGQMGISIAKKNAGKIDTSFLIRLSQGQNIIESSITNINGTESYRMPLVVNYTPAIRQKEMTRFIGIGIDRFADSRYNLNYSTKDIRDLAMALKSKYGESIVIDTLFNENVTADKIKALKKSLLQASVNDKVVVSYSGHGLLSKEFNYYLSTYAVNFEKPEQNGLPYEELENLLDSIPVRKKLLLIDACHSGEVDKDEMQQYKRLEGSFKNDGIKGIILKKTDKPGIGAKNSFDLMQSLFVNVGRSTGATVISAAAGTQFALENGSLRNGVFTYSILELMKEKSSVTISELQNYVNHRVTELTHGMQIPASRNENKAIDWKVW